VFNARSINEIVSRPQTDRVVIECGKRLAVRAPDYSELWEHDEAARAERVRVAG
jgi:cytosine deaminase